MTPEDLCDAIVAAVASGPVLIEVDGLWRELASVEAAANGRLVLHASADIIGFAR